MVQDSIIVITIFTHSGTTLMLRVHAITLLNPSKLEINMSRLESVQNESTMQLWSQASGMESQGEHAPVLQRRAHTGISVWAYERIRCRLIGGMECKFHGSSRKFDTASRVLGRERDHVCLSITSLYRYIVLVCPPIKLYHRDIMLILAECQRHQGTTSVLIWESHAICSRVLGI